MAERADIAINYRLNPRLLTVEKPSIDFVVQDIVDTCRNFEDELEGIDEEHLINASGKEELGGGVRVGITAELQNAVIAFEARTDSIASGTVTTQNAGTLLVDSNADFVTDGITPGDTIINYTDRSVSTILQVNSATQLLCTALNDGLGDTFEVDDVYKIYTTAQCEVTGGNLVAVDDNSDTISPIFPTAFTQIIKTSSSSATLQQLESLQHSSFNNGVTIDTINGTTGTDYPKGTGQLPVNNLTDAVLIAIERGFEVLYIIGNITFGATDVIDTYTIIGQNPRKTAITLVSGVSTVGCEFKDATINGVLAGNSWVKECTVNDLTYIHGQIKDCLLVGTITLSGSVVTNIVNCYDGLPGDLYPVIDMGGAGQPLVVSGYHGTLLIRNKSGTDAVSLDIDAGEIVLDSTVTAGTLNITGVGTVTDNSTGTTVVNKEALINQELVSKAVWDQPLINHLDIGTTGNSMLQQSYDLTVFIDTVNGSPGATYPYGTREQPVNTIDDALTIATAYGLNRIHIIGALELTGGVDVSGYTFLSDRSIDNSITVTSAVTNGTFFQDLTVTGTMNGVVRLTSCLAYSVWDIQGGFKDCLLAGNVSFVGTGNAFMTDTTGLVTGVDTYKEIDVGAVNLNLVKCNGMLQVNNITGSNIVYAGLSYGEFKIDSTCVSGRVHVDGFGVVEDNSGAGCVVRDDSVTLESIWETEEALIMRKMIENKVTASGDTITILDDDGVTIWRQYNLTGGGRVRIL